MPYNNKLFLTKKIESFELVEKLISDATKGLELNRNNQAIKIWSYYLPLSYIGRKESPIKILYESKSLVSKSLNVQFNIITNHLDKWIPGGINGNYIFTKELDELELNKLKEVASLRKTNNIKIWAYSASNLELLEVFNSMQKAADYFNVGYRSILNNLDTKLSTQKKDKLVLFFSFELTEGSAKKNYLYYITLKRLKMKQDLYESIEKLMRNFYF